MSKRRRAAAVFQIELNDVSQTYCSGKIGVRMLDPFTLSLVVLVVTP
jgi:hypothetical protein